MNRLTPVRLQHVSAGELSPAFSIVIPTYQRRDVVRASVEALARIDYPGNRELIVVVDGSTDGTVDALSRIDCSFPFRIIEQRNSGAASARNRGAAEASHEIILFLDDDMIADSALLDEHARCYRAGTDAVVGDTVLDPESPPGFLSESIRAWIDASRIGAPLTAFDVWAGQLSVRRSVFEELGGFDESFTSNGAFANEDADFGVKLLSRFNVRHNPAAISRQRYVVGARELMDRAPFWASGDIRFVRKHPELARDLFKARGATQRRTRFVYRPLSRFSVLTAMLRHLSVWGASLALKTPLQSSRTIGRLFTAARAVAYWHELRRRGWFPTSEKVLTLCYHAIDSQGSGCGPDRYTVSPEAFTKQLDDLSARGFTFINPRMFEAYLTHEAPMPRRAALLTFDDGYADLIEAARDVLVPRGIEALAFVLTKPASRSNEWDAAAGARRRSLLEPAQFNELANEGVEIGSHARTHRALTRLQACDVKDEIQGSVKDLGEQGLEPRFFAYPYGELDAGSMSVARDADFVAAFGIEARWVTRRSDPFNLPRLVVLATDRGWRFRLKTRAPTLYNWLADPANLAEFVLRKLTSAISGRS